jgi:alanine racemase
VSRTARARTDLRPTRIEVELGAIRRNVDRIRDLTGTEVCAVVKADGYGHGALPVARAALEGGAAWLAVSSVEEGQVLRAGGIDAPVLLLSEPPIAAVPELMEARLTPTVYRVPFLAVLDGIGHERGRPVPIHVKLDTGMARVGVPPDEWGERLEQFAVARGVEVAGLSTHLARAEELGVPTTREQLAAFDRGIDQATKLGLRPRWLHAANSAGALAHPEARYGLVRPGIALYGLSPGGEVDAADHGLEPALSLVSEVSFAKRIAAGTPVSYGHRWRAPADGWLATLPIGYADGLPRALTNRAQVLLHGRRRPLVGTITMDQVLVWCDQDEPHVGDEVVLLGDQGDQRIRVEEWAAAADTITYEIVTQLTARLPRHHLA